MVHQTSWACLGRNEKKSADVAVAELSPAETLVPVATIRREPEEPCYGLGNRRWVIIMYRYGGPGGSDILRKLGSHVFRLARIVFCILNCRMYFFIINLDSTLSGPRVGKETSR